MKSKSAPFLLSTGRNIRRWRVLKEIKQESLAQQIGISKAALSLIENGKTDIPLSRIHQIAEVLKISESKLIFIDPLTLIESV
jgi:transcriptional regulator with XRE-family HTH domain